MAFLACIAGVMGYSRYISPILENDPAATTAPGPVAAATTTQEGGFEVQPAPVLSTSRPDRIETGPPDAVEKGEKEDRQGNSPADPKKAERALKLYEAGRAAEGRGDLVSARANLSDAVNLGLPHEKLVDARASLTRIGAETVFGPRIPKDDPFVSRYTVASGDSLAKIAKRYEVSDDFLAWINDLKNKNMIRVGQTLKVVQGPFHAVVDKSDYSLDIYLQTTFVKHYPVGLGTDGSTPTGKWEVDNKLRNPTWYPPRGGQIIAADDPKNPLGDYWIGLHGVDGEALGQERYGIHGTIEPESIGKNMSLGCIRMHNEDVAEVFMMLVPGKSTVVVK